MKTLHRISRGFSLVEVTLALGICSFCLISLVGILPAGVTATANASRETTALNIASSILADFQSIGQVPASGGGGSMEWPEKTAFFDFPCGIGVWDGDATNQADPAGKNYSSQFLTNRSLGGGSSAERWVPVNSDGQYWVKVRISPSPSADVKPSQCTYTVEVSWPGAASGGGNKQGSVTIAGKSRAQ